MKRILLVCLLGSFALLSCDKEEDPEPEVTECKTEQMIQGRWVFQSRTAVVTSTGDPYEGDPPSNETYQWDGNSHVEFSGGEFTWFEEYDGQVYRDMQGETECISPKEDDLWIYADVETGRLIPETIVEVTASKLVFQDEVEGIQGAIPDRTITTILVKE